MQFAVPTPTKLESLATFVVAASVPVLAILLLTWWEVIDLGDFIPWVIMGSLFVVLPQLFEPAVKTVYSIEGDRLRFAPQVSYPITDIYKITINSRAEKGIKLRIYAHDMDRFDTKIIPDGRALVAQLQRINSNIQIIEAKR